jgi:hypothetical protein
MGNNGRKQFHIEPRTFQELRRLRCQSYKMPMARSLQHFLICQSVLFPASPFRQASSEWGPFILSNRTCRPAKASASRPTIGGRFAVALPARRVGSHSDGAGPNSLGDPIEWMRMRRSDRGERVSGEILPIVAEQPCDRALFPLASGVGETPVSLHRPHTGSGSRDVLCARFAGLSFS